MKEKSSNELIPIFINKINKYSEKFKDRVKIDGILKEIDLYAHEGFQKFIKLSDKRYKYIKSGTFINNLLEKKKNEYNELSNNILLNNLYISNDVENESKKLYKKINVKESKELYNLRKAIINKNKNLTPPQTTKRKLINNKKTKNKDFSFEKGQIKKEINIKNKYKNINKKEVIEDNIENFLKIKKQYLSDIVESDKNNINLNIERYKDFLKDVENTKDKSKISKVMNKNDNLGHKYSFNINNIKLLSYKEDEKKKEILSEKKIEDDSTINIKKLMQYTKRGNKKWFKEQIRQKSLKKLISLKLNLKRKEKSIINLLNKNNSFTSKNDKKINNIQTMFKNFNNFGNTIKTVKNEAEFIKNIKQSFDIKRKTLNKFFTNNHSLSKLDELSIRSQFPRRNTVLTPTKLKDKNFSFLFNLKRENYNLNDNKDKKIKYIYDSFKEMYYSKINNWSKLDEEKKKIKKREKEKIENIQKYLNELKDIKRKPHLYIDEYSLRDGVNEKIKLFNRTLSGPIYNKSIRENKINNFNNFIINKEKERIINEELLKQKILEEQKISKEKDIQYQVYKKMIKNLNNDEIDKSEEKIDFKYKSMSSYKNNDKNSNIAEQAYKEYLQSLKMIKKKFNKNKN